MFWRLHAQRLLVERGKTDVKDDLLTIIEQDTSRDALGLSPAVIHALWAASGLGVLDGVEPSLASVQKAAFTHPSPSVRRNAALAFPPNVAAPLILKYELLKDQEKLVRLAALLALADAGAGESPSGRRRLGRLRRGGRTTTAGSPMPPPRPRPRTLRASS